MKNTNIRSKLAAAGALTVLLSAVALFTTAGHHPGTPKLSDQLFAQRIAGSYLTDFPDGTRVLVMLGLGGGTHRELSIDFIGLSGFPDLPFYFSGGGFGNWKRTGPRTIHLVELDFEYGSDGLLSAIGKFQVDIEFNPDLQSATGSAAVGIYLPTQDPLTEEPVFTAPVGEELIIRRIR